MEFTLKQLTPENLKILFEGALYSVTDVTEHELDERGNIKTYGGITIQSGGCMYFVMPQPDRDVLKFQYLTWSGIEEGETEEDQYKVSNTWDNFAINARFNGRDDFDGNEIWSWTFIYSRLVPEEIPLTAKDLVMTFRLFQNKLEWSLRNWHLIEQAALA